MQQKARSAASDAEGTTSPLLPVPPYRTSRISRSAPESIEAGRSAPRPPDSGRSAPAYGTFRPWCWVCLSEPM